MRGHWRVSSFFSEVVDRGDHWGAGEKRGIQMERPGASFWKDQAEGSDSRGTCDRQGALSWYCLNHPPCPCPVFVLTWKTWEIQALLMTEGSLP